MKHFSVLLVDDEERILRFLKLKMQHLKYRILTATNGIEALEQIKIHEPDLVVLDLLMPKMNGYEVLEQLRTFSSVPVIILSAKSYDIDKILGLHMGADDYLAKPFNPDELIARIEAIRRRLSDSITHKEKSKIELHNLTIDVSRHQVIMNGIRKNLTRIEWLLLSEFVNNLGQILTYEELLSRIWGPEYRNDIQILRTWIGQLRRKIELNLDNFKLIRTVPKVGYIMDIHPSTA